MLGRAIHDPHGVESPAATTAGLGLLPVVTTLERDKITVRVRGRVAAAAGPFARAAGADVDAYEIHAGRTEVMTARRPFRVLSRQGRPVDERDGALDDAGNVVGTYLHGLFGNAALRRALLLELAARGGVPADPRWGTRSSAAARYNRLADAVGAACDLATIGQLVGLDLVRSAGRP
jgi:adenosylcobyric acid synthase